ncbi:MAG: anti-sigma factor [Akkermansiaceae bacterium]|nr:anti-sigma factor [Akkermansiaceae bacterium]NNM31220.1 anti-sigma factor [Akkermansiaceae bacterium]
MTTSADHDRFEELDAGRVLGDLEPEELAEWERLSRAMGARPDHGLDLAAAAVSFTFASQDEEALPETLAERIRAAIPADPNGVEKPGNVIRPTAWQRLGGGQAGWAVAAVLAILLVATFLTRSPDAAPDSLAEAREELLRSDPGALAREFKGVGDYEGMSGDVVWSDDRQEGYMKLTLPANDPSSRQYQLWIVDPERDEAPVDGGVFDIESGDDSAIVRIDAKLAVDDPKAFVITLEQPGGVVKSKQEVVVALASL